MIRYALVTAALAVLTFNSAHASGWSSVHKYVKPTGNCSGGQEICRCAVARRRRAGNVAFLLEQWQGFADDVADGGPADAAEGVSVNVQRAQPSVVEEGEQDMLAVADLLVEDAAAGAGLAWSAAPLIGQAFGLGGLPPDEPAGEFM